MNPSQYLPAIEWDSHPSNEKIEASRHLYDQDLVTSWTRTNTSGKGNSLQSQRTPVIIIATFGYPVPHAASGYVRGVPSFVLVFTWVITYIFRHVSRSAVHSLSTYLNKAARVVVDQLLAEALIVLVQELKFTS